MPENRDILTNGPDLGDSALFWLWIDPRGHELAAGLERAIALFRSKDRWGGQAPNAVKAHPDQLRNGLGPVARAAGLEVLEDPRVAAGTYMLGLLRETMVETEGQCKPD